jgi:hypothetical protein
MRFSACGGRKTESVYVFFDVECRGLFGEAFAWGYFATKDDGTFLGSDICCAPVDLAGFTPWGMPEDNRATEDWLRQNVLPHAWFCNMKTFAEMAKEQKERLYYVADVASPCETNFLALCYADKGDAIAPLMPYPLLDVSTLLLAKGYDPTATFARMDDELPAHNPVCDAMQSARIWFQLMRGEPVA